MTQASLVAHVDADVVSREQLALVPAPIPTATFKPIPHIQLVESLDKAIVKAGLSTVNEKLALRRDGQLLFGVRQIGGLGTTDGQGALGFRTANNKTMSLQMVAGLTVFVCDNMVFRGDMIALKRKHTSGLSLGEELRQGLESFKQHFQVLTNEIEDLKARGLTDIEAKAIIHDVFAAGIMPTRFLPEVSKQYFEPTHPEFEPRNQWSMHNAFTEVAKAMPVTTRVAATEEIGEFFGMNGKVR